jgi:hypothetical protein
MFANSLEVIGDRRPDFWSLWTSNIRNQFQIFSVLKQSLMLRVTGNGCIGTGTLFSNQDLHGDQLRQKVFSLYADEKLIVLLLLSFESTRTYYIIALPVLL